MKPRLWLQRNLKRKCSIIGWVKIHLEKHLEICLTYGLYKDNVISCALTEDNGLISSSGDSAKCSWGRRGPDKSIHVPGQFSHTSLITHQRPCNKTGESVCSMSLITLIRVTELLLILHSTNILYIIYWKNKHLYTSHYNLPHKFIVNCKAANNNTSSVSHDDDLCLRCYLLWCRMTGQQPTLKLYAHALSTSSPPPQWRMTSLLQEARTDLRNQQSDQISNKWHQEGISLTSCNFKTDLSTR